MIIGLLGKKQSGKTTVADYVHTYHGFVEITFAYCLKQVCKMIFNLSDDQLYGSSKEVVDPTWQVSPRVLMQTVGTDLFRNTLSTIIPSCHNIWIRNLLLRVQSIPDGTNIVVSDCRYTDEVTALKEMGAIIIKLERSKNVELDTHESECINDIPYDYCIQNDGGLDDLFISVDTILSHNCL